MFRILLVVLLANVSLSDKICGFPVFNASGNLKRGLIFPSSTDLYFLDYISIYEEHSNDFIKVYDLFSKFDIVPEILGASYAKSEDKLCNIIFKNVIKVDLRNFSVIAPIKAVFDKMIKAIGELKYRVNLVLNEKSFAYNPITDKYYFIDINNIFNGPSVYFTQPQPIEIFINFIFNQRIAVQISDIIDLNDEALKKQFGFYYSIYKETYHIDLKEDIFTIKDDVVFSSDKSSNSKIDIEITSDNENYLLTAKLEKQKKNFKFKKNESSFCVYLCQKREGVNIDCMNLKENRSEPSLVWTKKVNPGQRIDVEVQDAKNHFGKVQMRFYKIYLIITPEDTPGVLSDNGFIEEFEPNFNLNNYYIICETNHKDLRVASSSEEKFRFKTLKMVDNKLDNQTDVKISQVALSILPTSSKSCQGRNKKLFIMSKYGGSDNILFIKSNENNSALSLSYIPKVLGYPRDMIYSCNDPTNYHNLFYVLKNGSLSSGIKGFDIYPLRATLTRSSIDSEVLDEVCIEKIATDGLLPLNFEAETLGSEKVFNLNFNSHAYDYIKVENNYFNLPATNLVYLSSILTPEAFQFKFQKFQYPIFESYRIFISISLKEDTKYSVVSLFFPTREAPRQIVANSGTNLIFDNKPSKILYYPKGKSNSNPQNTNEFLFESLFCHYLSKSEIVYSLVVTDLEECHPKLESKVDDQGFANIEINCTSNILKKLLSSGEDIKKDSDLTKGLLKIKNQVQKHKYII